MPVYDTEKAKPATIVRRGMKPPSSTWSDLRCPFCNNVTRAYHWSLAGGGKKCETKKCGAKFDSFGNAAPVKRD